MKDNRLLRAAKVAVLLALVAFAYSYFRPYQTCVRVMTEAYEEARETRNLKDFDKVEIAEKCDGF